MPPLSVWLPAGLGTTEIPSCCCLYRETSRMVMLLTDPQNQGLIADKKVDARVSRQHGEHKAAGAALQD